MRRTAAAVLVLLLFAAGCGDDAGQQAPAEDATSQATDADSPGMANPASVHCAEQGGQEENRTDADGGQRGVCVFEDGTACDSWAFYREECEPGATPADQA